MTIADIKLQSFPHQSLAYTSYERVRYSVPQSSQLQNDSLAASVACYFNNRMETIPMTLRFISYGNTMVHNYDRYVKV